MRRNGKLGLLAIVGSLGIGLLIHFFVVDGPFLALRAACYATSPAAFEGGSPSFLAGVAARFLALAICALAAWPLWRSVRR